MLPNLQEDLENPLLSDHVYVESLISIHRFISIYPSILIAAQNKSLALSMLIFVYQVFQMNSPLMASNPCTLFFLITSSSNSEQTALVWLTFSKDDVNSLSLQPDIFSYCQMILSMVDK
jgi:hypothetical protein